MYGVAEHILASFCKEGHDSRSFPSTQKPGFIKSTDSKGKEIDRQCEPINFLTLGKKVKRET